MNLPEFPMLSFRLCSSYYYLSELQRFPHRVSSAILTGIVSEEEQESKRRSLATGLFCVAIQGADPTALQTGLNYACGPGHADCSPIQPGGKCYKPNDLPALASYAYNDYYQRNSASGATCNFSGTATTTPTDPSKHTTTCSSLSELVFSGSDSSV